MASWGAMKGRARAMAVLALTLFLLVIRLAARLVGLALPKVDQRARNGLLRFWGRAAIVLLRGRLRVEGTPPAAPFFLVTNHLSYIDIFVLSAVASPVFVAKSEIAGWPLVGFLCRQTQMLFIKREQLKDMLRVNQRIEEAFHDGYGIHVFPEGGIPADCRLKRFRPGLLEVPARGGYPVLAAGITYLFLSGEEPARERIAWPPGTPLAPHVFALAGGPPFEAVIRFDEEPIVDEDRKALADRLQAAVEELHTPLS